MDCPAYVGKLREIVGRDRVLDGPEDRLSYSYDATPTASQLPVAVVIPRSVDDVAAVLALANDARFGVVPRGSGSGLSGGALPTDNSVVLLMAGFTRVLELDEENLTCTVEPGVITAQVHQRVEARGLFYPPDPGSMNVCTIGGNVAENSGGLRGLKYGVTKDYILGIEAVLPTGQVVQTGGKCMKDVAGYNLTGVLVGSEGTLAVFTKVLLKLIPKPETSKTLLALFDRLGDAAQTVSDIIAAKVIPCTLEYMDRTTIQCVEDYARIGLPTDLEALLLIEVDGRPAVVEEDAGRVAAICRERGARAVSLAADAQEALRLKAARRTAVAALARRRPTIVLEDATVPRSQVAAAIDRFSCIAREEGLEMGIFGHAGDGNLHPTALIDERNDDEVARAHRAFDRIYEATLALGGTITGEHGIGLTKRHFLEKRVGSAGLDFMRKIREVLDPHGVLNPGKIFECPVASEGTLPRRREVFPASPWTGSGRLANDGFPTATV